jgi:hypothetical protein
VLLGGGTPNEPDFGAARTSALCRAIKKRTQLSVYAMLVPSADPDDVKRLRDAGVDELGFNMEFYSEEAARKFMPGKYRCIGRERYLRTLSTAAKVFGPVASRSLLIIGLEAFAHSLQGVQLLTEHGIMPILSPFRALRNSHLEDCATWPATEFIDFYETSRSYSRYAGLPLGPTCLPCQNNILAMPEDEPSYRFY